MLAPTQFKMPMQKNAVGVPEPPEPVMVMPKMKNRYPETPYNIFGDQIASPSTLIAGSNVPMPPPPPKKQRTNSDPPRNIVLIKATPKDPHGSFQPTVTSEMMMSPMDRKLIEAAEMKDTSPSSSRSDSISGEPLLCPICHRHEKRVPFNTRAHLHRHLWKEHAVSEPPREGQPSAT